MLAAACHWYSDCARGARSRPAAEVDGCIMLALLISRGGLCAHNSAAAPGRVDTNVVELIYQYRTAEHLNRKPRALSSQTYQIP